MRTFPVCSILITLAAMASLLSCNTGPRYELNETLTLSEGWSFRMEEDEQWLPATVPGCVHTDLLRNGKIEDPFYRNNEKQLQWIDKKNWVYRCEFRLDSLQIRHNRITMLFRGLDTYASVTLNGHTLLKADNMFRSWRADVKDYLLSGNNVLEILFTSPVSIGLEKLEELGYALPAVNDQSEVGGLGDKKVSVFTRKAPYHYGWDWGPRFVTSGVWRPVELQFIDHAHIANVFYMQSLVTPEDAAIEAIAEIDARVAGEYRLSIFNGKEAEPVAMLNMPLEQGLNSVTLPFHISSPELWWPNDMGEQYRYKFQARLSLNDVVIDTLSHRIGIRSLKLVREPDSTGTSFYFSVNGKPVFAKGANYIPNDNFLNEVTPAKYEMIVKSAASSHMNMLRVWGGGIYENDLFYELCDRYGLLIWHDFMFACSMYPGDKQFLDNVVGEVTENVRRLRNHPSIALWCGNNEIDVAWCEGDMNCGWSWKQQYSKKQRQEIWHNYDTLFHKILPEILALEDPLRSYWPSSPTADWGRHATYSTLDQGDIHYWGVWHGNEPFDAYYNYIGRFMSEYGFQSLPDMQSIGKFTLPEDWDYESEVLLSHQRSGYGNSRIIDYMKKLYPVPDDFAQLLYVGQVMQAEAINAAILAHRAHKPHCMGTLYWQLNDCWPSASWSGIDYYGSWKALQFFAGKAFAPVAISFFPDDDRLRVFINSDLQESRKVDVRYAMVDFEGEVLKEETLPALLDPAKGTEVFSMAEADVEKEYETGKVFLLVELLDGKEVIASDHYFFVAPKDLQLPALALKPEIQVKGNRLTVELGTGQLVKNLYLWVDNFEARFSDNYFDLLPGEKVTLSLEPGKDVSIRPEDVHFLTLNEILVKP